MKKVSEKEIVRMYQKDFLSMQQIADIARCSLGKIRYILDKHKISRRKRSEAIRFLNLTKYGKEDFKIKKALTASDEKLKIAGVMLYWGEGTKLGNMIAFSNSNPEMVKLFLAFLRRICGVSEKRLRVLLHIYSDQDEKKLKTYWSSVLNIPLSQFSKSYLHRKTGGSYRQLSKYGTASLRYADKKLLGVINNWIEKYGKDMV